MKSENRPELPRLVYSVKEVADCFNVSQKSVYRLVQRGKLKACKSLRHLRITRKSVDDLLAE